MKKSKSNLKIMAELIVLVKPMLPVMFFAVFLGILGFIAASAIPVGGVIALLNKLGFQTPLSFKTAVIVMAFAAVLRGVLRYGEQASNHYLAFKLLAIIRSKVFGALRRLAPAKLEGSGKGNLIALITSDVELLEVFYAHTISPIIIATVTSIIYTLFIASFSPALALIAAAAYIFVGIFIPLWNEKNVKAPGRDYNENSGELNTIFLDSLRGLKELMQYDCVNEKQAEILEKTKTLEQLQNKLKSREVKTLNITEITIYVFNIIMIFSAFSMCTKGIIPFSSALICSVTLMSSYGPVTALSNLSNNLAKTLASGERVLNLLEEEPETEDKTDGIDKTLSDVDCQNVSFGYGDVKILDGISLKAEENKITGILGKSGCGKSTLLKLIMRFWDKDSGEILLSGSEIKEINTECLRQNQSYCTQETHLFNDTIANNIKIAAPKATQAEIEVACKKASLHDFVMTLPDGYNTQIGELGDRLSGGEKQRIGLARAFLSSAPIILLDEPTSNLDSLNEKIILKALCENHDKTVILVSHRPSTLSIANKIYNIQRTGDET
ncbi:MAG: ABC transporter ATP-binding protein/permease [Clostridiales bacterium]|nr:ABC transporter ATP-binding protein/permease [Clostridiales bacterium]